MRRVNVRAVLVLLAVLCLFAVMAHFAHAWQMHRAAKALLAQAGNRKASGDLAGSTKFLQRYTRMVPSDTGALATLGMSLADLGQSGRALLLLEQVLRREPDRQPERQRVIEIAMKLGRYSDAADHLRTHVLRREDTAAARDLLAQCFVAQGKFVEADREFQNAVNVDAERTSADMYLRWALLLRQKLDRGDEADAKMQKLVAEHPGRADFRLARARYLRVASDSSVTLEFRQQVLTEALSELGSAIKLDPDNTDILLAFADTLRRRAMEGDLVEAQKHLEKGLELAPSDYRWYNSLCQLRLAAGDTAGAETALRQGLAHSPGNENLLWPLCEILFQSSSPNDVEIQKVIAELRKASYPEELLDYLSARLLVAQGKWLEAISALQNDVGALSPWPDVHEQGYYWLAYCYGQIGEVDRQVSALRSALNVDPTWLPARIALGKALIVLGRIDEAVEQFQQTRRGDKAPTEVLLYMARLLVYQQLRLATDKRDWRQANQWLDYAAKAQINQALIEILRAEIMVAQDDIQGARTLLATASEKSPDDLSLRLARAALEQRDEKWEAAEQILTDTQNTVGDLVEVRLAWLRLYMQQRGLNSAEVLQRLEADQEKFEAAERVQLLNSLASAFLSLGVREHAIRLWRESAAIDPNDLTSRLFLFDMTMTEVKESEDAVVKERDQELESLLSDIERIEGQQAGPLWRYGRAAYLAVKARRGDRTGLAEARRLLTEARIRRPAWSRVPLLEADIAEMQNDLATATERYEDAVQLGELRPSVVRRLVQLFYRQRRYAEADMVLRRLEEQQVPFSADLGRLAADISLRVEDYTRALDLAERAAAKSTDFRDHLWFGQLQRALRRPPEEAQRSIRRAIELAGDQPDVWIALIQQLASTNQSDEIAEALISAEQRLPPREFPVVQAQAAEALARIDDAERYFRAALAAQPDNFATLRAAADFFLRNQKPVDAGPLLEQIITSPDASAGDIVWARRSKAIILASTGEPAKLAEALKLLTSNLSSELVHDLDRRAKALVLARSSLSRDREEAISLFEQLCQSDSYVPNDRFLLAQLHLAKGDWRRYREHMQQLLATDSENVAYLAVYIRGLLRRKEADEAAIWLTRLEAVAPDSPETLELRARVLMAQGKVDDAIAGLTTSASSDGSNQIASHEMANIVEELAAQTRGQPGDRSIQLMALVERFYRTTAVSDIERDLSLASFYGRQGRASESLLLINRYWTSNPERVSPTAAALVSSELLPARDEDLIEQQLTEAMQRHPDNTVIQLALAQVHDAQRQHDQAETIYRKLLAKDAKNVIAMNNLAILLALRNKDYEAALKLIDNAIRITGPHSSMYDTRAMIFIAARQYSEAVAVARTALDIDEGATTYFHLAQALYGLGDLPAASEALEKARNAGLATSMLHALERSSYDQLVHGIELATRGSAVNSSVP